MNYIYLGDCLNFLRDNLQLVKIADCLQDRTLLISQPHNENSLGMSESKSIVVQLIKSSGLRKQNPELITSHVILQISMFNRLGWIL